MPARIYPRRPPRLYLAEWREAHKPTLTQKALGERLGVSDVTVSRWETGERRPDINVIAAYAEALGREFRDMFRHPEQPSADDLLRDQPSEVQAAAFKMIRGLRA
jgi:transcriptional regulator with XRE-family HTH domain